MKTHNIEKLTFELAYGYTDRWEVKDDIGCIVWTIVREAKQYYTVEITVYDKVVFNSLDEAKFGLRVMYTRDGMLPF